METVKLLAMVNSHCVTWEPKERHLDIYQAKKVAARLFIENTGSLVAKEEDGSYTVWTWQRSEATGRKAE